MGQTSYTRVTVRICKVTREHPRLVTHQNQQWHLLIVCDAPRPTVVSTANLSPGRSTGVLPPNTSKKKIRKTTSLVKKVLEITNKLFPTMTLLLHPAIGLALAETCKEKRKNRNPCYQSFTHLLKRWFQFFKGEVRRKMNFTYVLGFVVLRDVVKVFPVSSSSFARKTTGRNRARSHSGAWRGLKTKWDLKLSFPSSTYFIRYLFI